MKNGLFGDGVESLAGRGLDDLACCEGAEGGEDKPCVGKQEAVQARVSPANTDAAERMQVTGDGRLVSGGESGIVYKLDGRPSKAVLHRQQVVMERIVIAAD